LDVLRIICCLSRSPNLNLNPNLSQIQSLSLSLIPSQSRRIQNQSLLRRIACHSRRCSFRSCFRSRCIGGPFWLGIETMLAVSVLVDSSFRRLIFDISLSSGGGLESL
jgi:hypothetical protein